MQLLQRQYPLVGSAWFAILLWSLLFGIQIITTKYTPPSHYSKILIFAYCSIKESALPLQPKTIRLTSLFVITS